MGRNDMKLEDKLSKLNEILYSLKKTVVAFSGDVDSSFLLAAPSAPWEPKTSGPLPQSLHPTPQKNETKHSRYADSSAFTAISTPLSKAVIGMIAPITTPECRPSTNFPPFTARLKRPNGQKPGSEPFPCGGPFQLPATLRLRFRTSV